MVEPSVVAKRAAARRIVVVVVVLGAILAGHVAARMAAGHLAWTARPTLHGPATQRMGGESF